MGFVSLPLRLWLDFIRCLLGIHTCYFIFVGTYWFLRFYRVLLDFTWIERIFIVLISFGRFLLVFIIRACISFNENLELEWIHLLCFRFVFPGFVCMGTKSNGTDGATRFHQSPADDVATPFACGAVAASSDQWGFTGRRRPLGAVCWLRESAHTEQGMLFLLWFSSLFLRASWGRHPTAPLMIDFHETKFLGTHRLYASIEWLEPVMVLIRNQLSEIPAMRRNMSLAATNGTVGKLFRSFFLVCRVICQEERTWRAPSVSFSHN